MMANVDLLRGNQADFIIYNSYLSSDKFSGYTPKYGKSYAQMFSSQHSNSKN